MANPISEILQKADIYLQDLPQKPPQLQPPQGAEIAGWMDLTLLKPEATVDQVKELCNQAIEYQFASVCVNPVFTPFVYGMLKNTSVAVCTVVGFPLGATLPAQKAVEALSSINAGATEIDMVMNIGSLKGKAYGLLYNDIATVVDFAHNQRAIVKVILETALLTREEKIIACLISQHAGADFVKTSTGFSNGGATIEDVELMYRIVGTKTKVKAAGGIRDLKTAKAMIAAGASRLGVSAGVEIVNEANNSGENQL